MTDGTPKLMVQRSSLISLHRLSPSSQTPGYTIFIPISAAVYGSPHPFAWNIGTTSSTQSRSLNPMAPFSATTTEWRTVERWLYSTPLGAPVVPLV